MSEVTAAVLIIGNEVLSGKVEDTNSPFLVRSLRERGIELIEIRIVPDVSEIIISAVRELSAAATFLITTGGIGPTHDDVTIEAVARAFDRDVVHDTELLARLRERHGDELTDARKKMAAVPAGANVHACPGNPVTTVQLENLFILPGVPSLMRLCFSRIADTMGGSPLHTKALFLDVSEAEAAAVIAEVQERHADVSIGSYPRFDSAPFRVKLTVDGRDLEAVNAAHADLEAALDPTWLVAVDACP